MNVCRVKICGITTPDSARIAADAGADAIGLVFYAKSSRFVADLTLAREICVAAGPFVSTVGLFVDAEPGYVESVLDEVPLSLMQFHGTETEDECRRFRRPYIKAIRMKPGEDIAALAMHYPSSCGILLDAYRKGVPGGTGETFDWDLIPVNLPKPLVLAGGLHSENVERAVARVRPWAVDVSGGVESSPGVKDSQKIIEFVKKTKRPI